MALFEYSYLSLKGKKARATIDADSLQDAKLKLVRKQLAVLSIKELDELKDRLTKAEVLNLTKELTRLLSASLPLYEALSALEEKYRGQRPHRILLNLSDMVKTGYPFSQGLAKHPHTFDLLYISMVKNGEKTGSLEHALEELGKLIQKQISVQKQVLSALLYPGILSTFCFFVLGTLLLYVIPSLKELFSERDLHPFTRLVFGASDFVSKTKWFLTLGLVLGALLISFALRSKKYKEVISSLRFHIPFLKNIFAKVAFIRFARAMATLLDGGVPVLEALDEARKLMKHPKLEEVVLAAKERVSEGEPIHFAFQNHFLIPPLIPRMIAIAEEGGKLSFMMGQIAQIYEDELEKTLAQLTSFLQPILLLFLGAVIGFVLLSVLLPMTDVSSFST